MLLGGTACSGPVISQIDTGEFGLVEIFTPQAPINNFVFVFTGAEGQQRDDLQAVKELAEAGSLVALIDVRETLKRLPKLKEDCIYLPGPLEWISRNAQHGAGLTRYLKPLLFGRNTGGDLVYAVLAQAPPLSFIGGASLDFTGAWPVSKPPCRLRISTQGDGTTKLSPETAVRGHWLLAHGTPAGAISSPAFREVAIPYTEVVETAVQLYTAALARLGAAPAAEGNEDVSALPIVEVGNMSSTGTLVVIYSGDGGWRDLDRTLGETLAQKDYAVIGVDALHYFWSLRSPEESSADLARLLEHYLNAWDCQRVVLIGYSFGADILPFIYNRLPQPLREKVVLLSLLAPSLGASFEIHLEEWVTSDLNEDALPTVPEVARIEPSKLQCFYGEEDSDDTLCLDAVMKDADITKTGGGHHFDEDYPALAGLIDQAIRSRLLTAATSPSR